MAPVEISSLDATASLRVTGLHVLVAREVVEIRDANLLLAWNPEGCWVQKISGYYMGSGGGQRMLPPGPWTWEALEEHTPGFREAVLHALAELGVGIRLVTGEVSADED